MNVEAVARAIIAASGEWGSPIEIERRRRIDVAAWAYAYEIDGDPLVSDAIYDSEAAKIDPSVSTGHARLDEFFRCEFAPYTGQWVRSHPELHKLARVVQIKRAR